MVSSCGMASLRMDKYAVVFRRKDLSLNRISCTLMFLLTCLLPIFSSLLRSKFLQAMSKSQKHNQSLVLDLVCKMLAPFERFRSFHMPLLQLKMDPNSMSTWIATIYSYKDVGGHVNESCTNSSLPILDFSSEILQKSVNCQLHCKAYSIRFVSFLNKVPTEALNFSVFQPILIFFGS